MRDAKEKKELFVTKMLSLKDKIEMKKIERITFLLSLVDNGCYSVLLICLSLRIIFLKIGFPVEYDIVIIIERIIDMISSIQDICSFLDYFLKNIYAIEKVCFWAVKK